MELDIILESIVEATEGLGIVWRSDTAIIPLVDDEGNPTGETVNRREINGQVIAGDFGFFLRIVIPDEDTEMEPETWADLIVTKLSGTINDLSVYMNNASVDIKNKSRELASWERKHIGLPRATQLQKSYTEESGGSTDIRHPNT